MNEVIFGISVGRLLFALAPSVGIYVLTWFVAKFLITDKKNEKKLFKYLNFFCIILTVSIYWLITLSSKIFG